MRHVKKVRPKVYLSNKDLYCEIIYSKAKGRLTTKATQMLANCARTSNSKCPARV